MSLCRVCMAPIIWSQTEQGDRVPLDEHEQRDYGPERFRIIRDGSPPTVAAVAEDNPTRLYVDHRHICQQPRPI